MGSCGRHVRCRLRLGRRRRLQRHFLCGQRGRQKPKIQVNRYKPKQHESNFFAILSTKFGMYKPNCGVENLTLSWGHDEYLYRFLVHNKTTLPKQALWMIRFHSFYPWHSGNNYSHLTTKNDEEEIRKWVLKFK
jgi:hypothetical protein